jgi:hypothetical protein
LIWRDSGRGKGVGVEEKPDGLSTQIPDRRIQPRYAVDDRATLLLLNHGLSVVAQIVELSLGGCRLRVPRELRLRPLARVEVTFKVNGIAFRLSGLTRWSDGRQLVGIRFGEMTPRRRDELSELLGEIEAEVAAKAAQAEADSVAAENLEAERLATRQSAAERDAAERAERDRLDAEKRVQMKQAQEKLAQETLTKERLAEAKRAELKEAQRNAIEQAAAARAGRSGRMVVPVELRPPAAPLITSPVAKVAVETPLEAENQGRGSKPVPGANSAQRERRTQARHSVDSQANIFLVDVASRSAGRIVDVSLGGCRIHTNERFPVGIYRRVEVEFVLDGLPFRLGGVTQSLHDRQTVGIRFIDLSERKREQLTMLVEEIDQMQEEKSTSGSGGEG